MMESMILSMRAVDYGTQPTRGILQGRDRVDGHEVKKDEAEAAVPDLGAQRSKFAESAKALDASRACNEGAFAGPWITQCPEIWLVTARGLALACRCAQTEKYCSVSCFRASAAPATFALRSGIVMH